MQIIAKLIKLMKGLLGNFKITKFQDAFIKASRL